MIYYSKHAREKMIERGISEKEIEEAIKAGAKELQEPNKIIYHFRYFSVVSKKIKKYHFVITVKPRWKK